MTGIGNNYNSVNQGPPPTFNNTGYSANQSYGNTSTGAANPFSGGDSYNVDNTSKSFDQAMARLMGTNVLPQETQQTQQTQQTQLPPGVTQEELNWALGLEAKVKSGYQPTQQETDAYQTLSAKLSAGVQNKQTQQSQLPPGVTQQEIDWALAIETKVKSGYQPTQQETTAYQALAAKLAAAKNQPTNTTQQSQLPPGVTQQEIDWALAIETKVKSGYQPTQQETDAYQALAAKLAAAKNQPTNTTQQSQLPATVTQQEIDWALALETKVKSGYQPTQQETDTYQALATKLAAGNTQQAGNTAAAPAVSQQDIDWALALEAKAKTGYQPTPGETATYQDIAHRLQVSKSTGNTNTGNPGNKDWASWSQPFSVPRTVFQNAPKIIQVPANIRSVVPTLPQYSTVNVGPNLTPNQGTGAVNQSEIDWALSLEKKVKTGYNPTEAELYQYKNIADRLQANKGQVAPTQNTTLPQTGVQNTGLPQNNGTQTTSPGLGDRIKNAWKALTGG